MSSNRSSLAFLQKASFAGAKSHTFRPNNGFIPRYWEVRVLSVAVADATLTLETIDEDGDTVALDNSPLVVAVGATKGFVVWACVPALKVTNGGLGNCVVKVKAYEENGGGITPSGYGTTIVAV